MLLKYHQFNKVAHDMNDTVNTKVYLDLPVTVNQWTQYRRWGEKDYCNSA
jgi:hypothetical protein